MDIFFIITEAEVALLIATEVTHSATLKYVKRSLTTFSGPVRLSSGWSSSSFVGCAMDCRYRFSSKCYGFLYNSENQFCIPCGGISAYKSTPDQSEGDFYFIENDCESYVDFKQYNYIRHSEYQVQKDYDTARKTCRCLDSQLIVTDTYERWASYKLFQKTNTEYWLGMDDIGTEGTYVWSDGRVVATEWMDLGFSKTKLMETASTVCPTQTRWTIRTDAETCLTYASSLSTSSVVFLSLHLKGAFTLCS